MIAGFDSSFDAPSANDALTARDAGVRLWSGYLTTKSGVNIAAPWSQLAFENARLCGGTPLAFCSGWDDPVALRTLAQQWNVRLCLDCEDGIRGPGPWVPEWLAVSRAGLYGLVSTVQAYPAPFKIAAEYPGFDPGKTFPSPSGSLPTGWQWQGTHTEFGRSVDRGWYDDIFGTSLPINSRGGSMAGSIVRAPFDDNRLDLVWADASGIPRVRTSTGGSGGLDSSQEAAAIDGGNVPVGGFFDVQAVWDSLNRLNYLGSGNDGSLYLAVQQLDGTFAQGWSALAGTTVFVPVHTTTPVASVVDQELRTFLRSGPQ